MIFTWVVRGASRAGDAASDPASSLIDHLTATRTLRAVRALRRFTVRAQLPAPLAAAADPGHQPAVELASADPGPVRLARPRGLGAQRARPGPAARRDLRRPGSPSWRRTPRPSSPCASSPTTSRPTWANRAGTRPSARTTRTLPAAVGYFSMEFGVSRGAAELLRRPRRARRRPPQGGVRPRRAADRRRAAVPLGLLPPVAVAGRLAARALPGARPAGPAAAAAHRRRRRAGAGVRWRCRAGGRCSARVWQAAVGRVPLLLLDSDIEENEADLRGVTDRLYGGDQDHRIRQEILVGIGGVRAVRAFCAATGHPAPEVFHTNEGHAGYLGLERIRELQDAEGLSFDEALAAVRAGTVFTTHTPVPAGIDRFPVDMVRHYFDDSARRRRCCPACRRTGCSRSAPRTTRACSTWRTWACGWPSAPTACRSCTARSPGACSAACGGLRRRRGADRLGDQRRARPDLGGPRGHRAARARPRRTPPRHDGRGPSDALLWELRDDAARPAGRRGAPPGARGVAAARRVRAGAGLDRPRLRPGRADRRLRPPRAHLQAAHADAARPGPAARPAARPAPARCSWWSRARRTRPTTAARR